MSQVCPKIVCESGPWFIKTCAANPERFFSETSGGKVTGNWQPLFHLEQL